MNGFTHSQGSLNYRLPEVESQVVRTRVEDWEGPTNERFDLVLMFHVVHFVADRLALLQNIHDRWLSANGYVVVMYTVRTGTPGNTHMIFDRLGNPTPPWEKVEDDFRAVGFSKCHVYEMRMRRQLANLDESVLKFYRMSGGIPDVSLDYVRETIAELHPEGAADEFDRITVFRGTCTPNEIN